MSILDVSSLISQFKSSLNKRVKAFFSANSPERRARLCEPLEPRQMLSGAELVPLGSGFEVSTTPGDLLTTSPNVSAVESGGVVVGWMSLNIDMDTSQFNYTPRAQLFDGTGAKSGSELGISDAAPLLIGGPTSVAMANDGSFVAAYLDVTKDSGRVVYLRMFDSKGIPLAEPFAVNETTSSSLATPVVAMDSDGDFVVVWRGDDASGYGIIGQRFTSDGSLNGSNFIVNTTTLDNQELPNIAMAPDGSFVVVWQGPDADGTGVWGQRFDSSGNMQGDEFALNTYTTSAQSEASVAIDSTGAFIATWTSLGQDGDHYGIYAQRFDASGGMVGDEFLVNTDETVGEQYGSEVAVAADGSFLIVWHSFGASGYRAMGQYYNPDGTANDSNFIVNSEFGGNQYLPDVAAGADGTFIVAWTDQNGVIYGQRFEIQNEAPVATPIPALAMFENGVGMITLNDYFTDDFQFSSELDYEVTGNTNKDLLCTTIETVGSDVLLIVEGATNLYGAGVLTIRATDKLGAYVESLVYVDVAGSSLRYAVPVSEATQSGDPELQAFAPSVGMAGDGSYVQVWISADMETAGIYGQLFDALGNAVGDAFEIAAEIKGAAMPKVAVAFDGSFTVVWGHMIEDNDSDIYGRRFDASGNALGDSFLINTVTEGFQATPTVAAAYDGSFVVAWQTDNESAISTAVAQMFDADGVKVGGEFSLSENGDPTAIELQFSLAISPQDGSFIATWTRVEPGGGFSDIYGRVFDAQGVGDCEFIVNSTTEGSQIMSQVSVGANGEFVVVWESDHTGENQVFGQMFYEDGTPFDEEFQISDDCSDNMLAGVTVAADGSFHVAWSSQANGDSDFQILVQRYDNCGCMIGDVVVVDFQSDYPSNGANISGVGSGNFVVSWYQAEIMTESIGAFSQSFELTYQPYVADPIPDITIWLGGTVGFFTDLYGHFGPDPDGLEYSLVSNSNLELVSTTIDGEYIDYEFTEGMTGSATIVVKATAIDGTFITDEYTITVEELSATLTLPNTTPSYAGNLYDSDLFGDIDVAFIWFSKFSTGGVIEGFEFNNGLNPEMLGVGLGDFEITFTGEAGEGWIEFTAFETCGCGFTYAAKLYIVIEDVIAPEFEGFKAIASRTSVPVGSVDLFFSEAIDVDSFNWESITLTRDSGANLIDECTGEGLTFTLVNAASNRYRISGLADLTNHIGQFTLTLVDGGVTDPAGNLLGAGGQIDWEMQAATPSAPVLGPTNAGPYEAGYTSTTTPTVVGTGTPGSTVDILDCDDQLIATVVVDDDGNYSYTFGELALGSYTLRAIAYGPGDHVSAPSLDSTFTIADNFVSILSITQFPDPVLRPINAVGLQFSQGIDLSSFTWEDLVIRRNGAGPNLTNSDITIQRMSSTSLWYRVNLPVSMTVESGEYTFEVVRSGILDNTGKPIYDNAYTEWTRGYGFMEIAQFTSPVNTSVTAVTFKVPVPLDIDTLSWEDIQITRDGGLDLSNPDIVIERVAPGSLWYRIVLPASMTAPRGEYVVTVKGAGLREIYGNPIYGDISTSWTRANDFLEITQFVSPVTAPVTVVGFKVAIPLDIDTLSWKDIQITLDGGPDLSDPSVVVERVSANSLWYRVLIPVSMTTASGDYVVTVKGECIEDVYGNPLTSDISTSWTRAFNLTHIYEFPAPRISPVTVVGFLSSVQLDVDSITWEDIGLTLNDGEDISEPGITIERVGPDSLWYRINLPGTLTLPLGTYELTVKGTGIKDMYGNFLANNISTTWTRV